ncbi:hypothetical protein [Variovorax sp. EBFNA2]|uniref:hypothetical protein n=1 Tax=Variovorax sp. EBFNA2 TaxID=3342097 RepID=UPI0029BFDFFB|nr:hypothetical protein [Variovorax boronicumulans]WPG35295.1 hypothetical protein RZE79_17565 [Variovorax boronicumulans]
MSVQNSDAVRNAYGDAWEGTIGTSAKIQLRTGAQPANCAAAAAGTLLVEFALGSDWAPAAVGGVKSLGGTPIAGTAVAAGTAAHYRIYNTAGTVCHEQGTVTITGGGGDATVDNPSIVLGQTVNITGWSKTFPGA